MPRVDWRRALLALPVLAAMGLGLWFMRSDEAASDTPRASLVETPPITGAQPGVVKDRLARDFAGSSPRMEPVRLSDLRGAPVILNFWATWCTSCLAELPDFAELQREYGADRLHVLAVNTGEDANTAEGFIEDLGVREFRWMMDPTLVVADAYGVWGMPTTVFIDGDGVIRATYVGHLSKDQMREYVEAAMSARTAPEPDPRLRIVTTVARDHLLEVDDLGAGRVALRSKSFRCDDAHCGAAAIDALDAAPGVLAIERRTAEDPPAVIITYEPSQTDVDALASLAKRELDAIGDPLYERTLEIVRK